VQLYNQLCTAGHKEHAETVSTALLCAGHASIELWRLKYTNMYCGHRAAINMHHAMKEPGHVNAMSTAEGTMSGASGTGRSIQQANISVAFQHILHMRCKHKQAAAAAALHCTATK
jgi:hypothetical protein